MRGRRRHSSRRERGLELAHEHGVLRPAAADEHFARAGAMLVDRGGDALRGQGDRACAARPAARTTSSGICPASADESGRARCSWAEAARNRVRRAARAAAPEIALPPPPHAPLRSYGLAGMTLAPGIHQGVARSGVEPAHRSARRQIRDVGDAADIDDDTVLVRRAKTRGVECRHQRRALAAGRDVAAAEVGDDGDARSPRPGAPGWQAASCSRARGDDGSSARAVRSPRRRGRRSAPPTAPPRPRPHSNPSGRWPQATPRWTSSAPLRCSAFSSSRSSGAKSTWVRATARQGSAPKSARTASTPSTLVPDISPTKSSELTELERATHCTVADRLRPGRLNTTRRRRASRRARARAARRAPRRVRDRPKRGGGSGCAVGNAIVIGLRCSLLTRNS